MGKPTMEEQEYLLNTCEINEFKANAKMVVATAAYGAYTILLGFGLELSEKKTMILLAVVSIIFMGRTHYKLMQRQQRMKRMCKYIKENIHRDFDEVCNEIIEQEARR